MDIDINQREYDKFDESNRVKTTADTQAYDMLIDEASATNTYIGYCKVGEASKTNENIWRIKKIDTTTGTKITYADGSADFDKKWADRLAYTY
ncbi:hypothetical protein KO465_07540 [Candidatus Micrarchaeota archaeon]|jgi:hypothetical protein|nr:hypothetical protein [Candidatus Micrarchaeota archaeon]